VRVAPRLGAIDESRALRAILDEIGRGDGANRVYAQFLRAAQTIRILREAPWTTHSGKTPAVVKRRETGILPSEGHA
jgi:hypothetical protein